MHHFFCFFCAKEVIYIVKSYHYKPSFQETRVICGASITGIIAGAIITIVFIPFMIIGEKDAGLETMNPSKKTSEKLLFLEAIFSSGFINNNKNS